MKKRKNKCTKNEWIMLKLWNTNTLRKQLLITTISIKMLFSLKSKWDLRILIHNKKEKNSKNTPNNLITTLKRIGHGKYIIKYSCSMNILNQNKYGSYNSEGLMWFNSVFVWFNYFLVVKLKPSFLSWNFFIFY